MHTERAVSTDNERAGTLGAGAAAAWMALGALAGALGGAAAALVDYGLGAEAARQFLPDGTARLALFLVGFYGAAAAAAGALAALALGVLATTTDLGLLVGAAFGRRRGDEEGGPLAGLVPAALVALAGYGFAMREVTRFALRQFHSPMLIAAWAGLVAAALVGALVLAALVLGALLGVPLRRTRLGRARLRPGALPAVVHALMSGGVLALTGGGVALLVQATQKAHGLTQAVRAQRVGLWAPLVALGAVVLVGGVAHLLWKIFGVRLRRLVETLSRPLVLLGLGAGVLAVLGGVLAAWQWALVRLLPWRPALVVAVAVVTGAAAALALGGWIRQGRVAPRVLLVLLVPAGLFLVGLQAGRADRVLKAGTRHSALAAPLLAGLHAAIDFDRDGYSPLLGADCDDLDAEVHPGAFDWPDDGIDQNCNGHDATLQRAARPPFPAVPASVPRRPNVLLITVDALRADHLGAYGYSRDTSPRIDELASEGVLFEHGWAHSPSTRYSVPAIHAGRYESTIAWGSPSVHWPPQVLPENRLLAEVFKEQGYRTGAIVPTRYFEPAWGLDQGFDDYDWSLAKLHDNIGGDPAKARGSSSKEESELGIAWLKRAAEHPDQPFFLWMHFYDPHYLYERHPDSPSFGDRDEDLYDGEIRYTDTYVGHVLDALRQSGQWEHTIIVFTSDHGEGFGEHGVLHHGYHIYIQQNRVPFIVRVPGIAPRKVAEPVGHVDLFPSLLNLLGLPDEPQLLGRSFVDLMLGGGEPRMVFQEVDYEGPTSRKGVATRTHQLIANVIPDGTYEYYDLEHDPGEEHDRFVRGADGEQERLRAALGQWMDEIALPENFKERVADNLSTQPLPSQTRLDADLGGMLTIEGVTVRTPRPRPGEQAEVDLVLRVPKAMPAGWRLFTHAAWSRGGFVNLDHEPVEGFVPLKRLRPGQWVRDRVRFMVPRHWTSGTVRLEVGLFKKQERAQVHGPGLPPGDSLVAATLELSPKGPPKPAQGPTLQPTPKPAPSTDPRRP